MKNTQERLCQSCREKKSKEDLIKITKLQDGTLKINPSFKEIGRSMYVCKNSECIKLLIKKKKIKTSLKIDNQNEILRIEEELLNFKTNN